MVIYSSWVICYKDWHHNGQNNLAVKELSVSYMNKSLKSLMVTDKC